MSVEPRGETAYRIEGLTFSYGGPIVLSLPELTIRRGLITVVTGPNASGKTTLLKLFDGLLLPTGGTIARFAAAGSRRGSVFVHSSPPMMSGSALRNVCYGLRARSIASADVRSRARAALEAMGLSGVEHRRASALSSGQRKRLALARAMAPDPEVLLLDEPDANVDADSLRTIERVLLELALGGTTIVASTHDAGFGYRIADELVVLESGRLQPSGLNVLRGGVAERYEGYCLFESRGVRISCPAREGEARVAVVPLHDVFLSLTPVETSARNRMQGTVESVAAEGGLHRVTVDCGIRLSAYVTAASLRELGIAPGSRLWVSFKASAVSLY